MHLALLLACQTASPPATPAPEAPPAKIAAPPQPLPKAEFERDSRAVVAVGDLHGDRKASLEVLQLAGLADASGAWVGGDKIFVQTGDLTDRGPDSKGVIDLLRALQQDAAGKGGLVVLLNGNHEVMNLKGDWRYVAEEDVAGFGGMNARKDAFSDSGEYGRFLASLPVIAKVGDTVFAHGGITPTFAELGVDGLNALARQHYFAPRGPDAHAVHGDNGPTWFRGYVNEPESVACPALEAALAALGARRMVVGHTTQKSGAILSRCGGQLAVIDTGISEAYGHHLTAWELLEDDAHALTPTGTVDLPDPTVASPSSLQ